MTFSNINNVYNLLFLVINDEELKKRGFYDPDAKLYDIDEELLVFRGKDQPKKKKMSHFEHESWH